MQSTRRCNWKPTICAEL